MHDSVLVHFWLAIPDAKNISIHSIWYWLLSMWSRPRDHVFLLVEVKQTDTPEPKQNYHSSHSKMIPKNYSQSTTMTGLLTLYKKMHCDGIKVPWDQKTDIKKHTNKQIVTLTGRLTMDKCLLIFSMISICRGSIRFNISTDQCFNASGRATWFVCVNVW